MNRTTNEIQIPQKNCTRVRKRKKERYLPGEKKKDNITSYNKTSNITHYIKEKRNTAL